MSAGGRTGQWWTRGLHAGYTGAVRPWLFRYAGGDPERIHHAMVEGLGMLPGPAIRAARAVLGPSDDPVEVSGLRFPNPVGLAAGLDKDAHAARAWAALGFGFAELGTVTPRPQPGNPSPRMFRLVDDRAVINRMGFNNEGSAALANRLTMLGVERGNGALGIPIGVSIGRNKLTANEFAVDDYTRALRNVAPVADYVAINVSSPNTPGLRDLQTRSALQDLFAELDETRRDIHHENPVPIWVKVAPELSWAELDDVVAAAEATGIDAIIATNTTTGRTRADGSPLRSAAASEVGGLSGAPLTLRAREVVGYLARTTRLPIIGSGGVMTPADAVALREAGASLVQVYTGFIYSGPALVRGIAAALAALPLPDHQLLDHQEN
ncbi:quinone-dependent dihydroorotate dehydrogenase [Tessaracoccus sp. SD287]|uniref:quinone-dependent dihydroorotate dehydrogenase n=1 Tax=Tessaracoccus sp. SD287 TaxID=2782008 RepID=UPI001A96CC7A|nr:quinone-dependent dihydroorotate dehydrogenase [Tessaracoccus sp. SD287]MBO1030139.1 quinone-dependent dihydroorotate dehydrogenase [Tessaracoccus sp. SD287]